MTQDLQAIEKTKASNQVTIWGLVINLLLGITKVISEMFFGSRALLADGMHSLLDLISYLTSGIPNIHRNASI